MLSQILPLMGTSDIQVIWSWGGNHWWLWTLKAIGFIGGIVWLYFKSHDHVPPGHKGAKKRFGRLVRHRFGPNKGKVKEYDPGLIWLIPGADKLEKVDWREHNRELKMQTKDVEIGQVEIYASISLRAIDLEGYILVHEDPNGQIEQIAQEKFCELALNRNVTISQIKPAVLSQDIQLSAAAYGMVLTNFRILVVIPTPSTQLVSALATTGLWIRYDPFLRNDHYGTTDPTEPEGPLDGEIVDTEPDPTDAGVPDAEIIRPAEVTSSNSE